MAEAEAIVLLNDFKLTLNHDVIFRLLDCYPESPVYDEMNQIYEELLPEVLSLASPKGVLAFSRVRIDFATKVLPEGSDVLFLVVTVGRELSSLSNKYFQQGDYPRGMMADAMADGCVFSMEDTALPAIREECGKRHIGIRHRYEAPVDLPMRMQKIAFEETKADINLGLGITSGYMLDPVKSNCQVFGITDDETMFQLEHDCRKCPRTDCPVRTAVPVTVQVNLPEGRKTLVCKGRTSLLQLLTENGIRVNAPCGGNRKCGKCGVRVEEGSLPVTDEDRRFFPEKQLNEGWRLSCAAYPRADLTVSLNISDESEFTVQTGFVSDGAEQTAAGTAGRPGIAIDIGTTTLVVTLVDTERKTMTDSWSGINPQRVFGSDVISRIQASNDGHGVELKKLIAGELVRGIRELCTRNGVAGSAVRNLAIAGNTTMGHLLLGFSCRTLGVVPFTPVDISRMRKSYREVFDDDFLPEAEVVFLPGISTYVGGDITAGFYSCGFQNSSRVCALIDLGTNGEMGIGTAEKILVTSTAAGPAFEGGNIRCGTGSIPGAVCSLKIHPEEHNRADVVTIGNRAPIGICGTGVIETAYELLKNGLVDETGVLEDPYFDDGFPVATAPDGGKIVFTQKDVREIQLAKSAVRAGFETLLYRYGVTYDEIDRLYLAGGFGFRIDKDKAIGIGMLPEELREKTVAAGNTSLGGAVRYLCDDRAGETTDRIVRISEEINLATDKKFNEFYMDYMMFGDE